MEIKKDGDKYYIWDDISQCAAIHFHRCKVEDVIQVCINRLRELSGRLSCDENDYAIQNLIRANVWLECRTEDRKRRGVEGTDDP